MENSLLTIELPSATIFKVGESKDSVEFKMYTTYLDIYRQIVKIAITFFLALEPRICTRWDMHKYARDAYNLGVRYIGGCCGFEPYHIRAVSEEVSTRI